MPREEDPMRPLAYLMMTFSVLLAGVAAVSMAHMAGFRLDLFG